MSRQISLSINGETRSFSQPVSVSAMLQALDITGGKVAVERNREIVPGSQHATTMLDEGDQIEIVHFIGGG